jgi:uncharacterized protein (TIGR03083 family)
MSEALRDQVGRFADLLPGADLGVAVPSCPGWDLGVLTEHVGQAHRRGIAALRGQVTVMGQRIEPDAPATRDGAGYRDWLLAGSEALISAGASAEAAGEQVWNFATGAGEPRFWLRRMTHETAVHRYDAALALATDYTLDGELASDALAEWLELLTSPGLAAHRPEMFDHLRGSGQTVNLWATDRDRGWLITRTPDGPRWAPAANSDGTVTVRAGVLELLLLATGRLGPGDERLDVRGDAALLRDFHEHVRF